MSLPTLVDVAIGLCFVYLGASLWVTVINEFIAAKLSLRGKQLAADLKKLIDCAEVRQILGRNPALAGFFGDSKDQGSYVDPKVVAQHLLGGLLAIAPKPGGSSGSGEASVEPQLQGIASLVGAVDSLPESGIKRQLQALVRAGAADLATLTNNVSVWIDQTLTMMGEGYKRNAQLISLGIGLALAVGFNLDTIGIVKHLYADKADREAIVAMATDQKDRTSKEVWEKCRKLEPAKLREDASCAGLQGFLEGLRRKEGAFGRLPIGWPVQETGSVPAYVTAPIGWLLTALAISLGASFWFDLLNRLVNIRHGMRKPEPETDKARSKS